MDDQTATSPRHPSDADAPGQRRPFRLAPLVFGCAFVGLGLMGLFSGTDLSPAWAWIGVLATVGVGSVVAAIEPLVRQLRSG